MKAALTESQTAKFDQPAQKRGFALHEDWTVVILGFVIIALAISGFVVPAPSFGWSSLSDFSAKVFSPKNTQAIGLQFSLVINSGFGRSFNRKIG